MSEPMTHRHCWLSHPIWALSGPLTWRIMEKEMAMMNESMIHRHCWLSHPIHLGTEWTTHLADNGEGDGNDERVNDSPTLAVPPHLGTEWTTHLADDGEGATDEGLPHTTGCHNPPGG